MKRIYAIITILLVIIIIILILLLRSCSSGIPPDAEPPPKLDFEEYTEYKDKSINIPATTGLDFKAGQLEQTVDFYNPDTNNCYFVISLYLSDDTLIYKSDYLKPSDHIYKITLSQKLQRGIYRNCRLIYNCYTLDEKSQLNSGKVKLEINSH